MEDLPTQLEFSFFQVKIDSKFWQGLSHHLKEELPTLEKVALLFPAHRYLDRFVKKGLEALKMVWMAMGKDDQINLFGRNPISFHLMEEFGNMTGMTWIDENSLLSVDQVSVTVVLILILP
jgi:hypothetical protein